MNRHNSECILIQSILCNNVWRFLPHVKTSILVAKRNLKTLWGALWHVKIISLVLSKAEHYVWSNRDITSSLAVTPYPQTIFTLKIMTFNNYFHICGKILTFKGLYYICRNLHIQGSDSLRTSRYFGQCLLGRQHVCIGSSWSFRFSP